MGTTVQVAGALLILAAFVGVQRGLVATTSLAYLLLNLVGGAVLAVDAYVERQWGFVVLQTAWTVVAAVGLLRRARR